ncbi:exosome non-catalytic core subunit [Saccharomycopsis crataegensis]|uniref:Ribosomal RNA-processing protein 40 n=1 Tax=Saccharomycopsis crataegensis TaxID=43959 RepID=A0AAV5QL24_9ASCO|nr:exosome non-catalytic core subunit [Saccharomycopsis crataegensis]
MSIIIPGDQLPVDETTLNSKKLTVGPSIYVDPLLDNQMTISNAGIFTHKEKKTKQLITVESSSKNYIPAVGDLIVGTVLGGFGEFFKVSLSNYKPPAILSYMAFENATKKNRPNLKTGSLVYARISAYDPNIDVELECFNPTTGKAEGFGELTGGTVVEVDLGFARYLMFNENNPVLEHLSKKCQFEIAIGVNGKVWIKGGDLVTTLACCQYIEQAQRLASGELEQLLKKLWKQHNI